MPTTVTYNSRSLTYPKVVRWDQEPVYDEQNINVLYVRHTAEIEFLVSAATPAAFMSALWGHQKDLAEPRKALLIDAGTGSDDHYVNLVDASAGTVNRIPDIEGGPKPSAVSIVMLAGEISATCRWTVGFVYQNVGTPGTETGFTKNIVSKTFQATFAIDTEGRQTRTFVGSARLRDLDANSVAMTMPRIRGLIPPVPYGFRRVACNISMGPDGLTVRVESIDRELTANWLHGVAEIIQADYTEGLPMFQQGSSDVNFIIQKQLNVRLRGQKGFRKQDLMDAMSQIISSRFTFINLDPEGVQENQRGNLGGDFPAQITWSESLVENELGVQVLAWCIPLHPITDLAASFFTKFLSDKFLAPLPSAILVSGRSQYGGGSGHDGVTFDHKGNDRLSFLTPVKRVILQELETHAVTASNPTMGGSDDFGLTPNNVVNSYIDGSSGVVPSDQQVRLADSCGLGPGGYLVDDETVNVTIDNGNFVMGNTTLGASAGLNPNGATTTYQVRAPRLRIEQKGRAYRVGVAPIARKRIKFVQEENADQKGVMEVTKVHPLPPAPFGPTMMFGVHWHYVTSYNLIGQDVIQQDADAAFKLNLEAREISQRQSRVFAVAEQDRLNPVLTYNPDTQT